MILVSFVARSGSVAVLVGSAAHFDSVVDPFAVGRCSAVLVGFAG